MKSFFLIFLISVLFSNSFASVNNRRTNPRFQCPTSSLFEDGNNNATKIYEGVYFFEGVTPFEDGDVYFTDVAFSIVSLVRGEPLLPVGRILQYSEDNNKVKVISGNSGKAIGMQRTHSGDLVVACGADFGERALRTMSRETEMQKFLTTTFQGTKYNSPNDIVVDCKKRILFTDPRYEGQPFETFSLPQGRVYSVDDNTKQVRIVIDDLEKGNGLVFNRDCSKLYVAESNNNNTNLLPPIPNAPGRRQIREYNYDVQSGNATFNRVVVDFSNEFGEGDGLELDSCGFLYVAFARPGGGVRVYNVTSGQQVYTINLNPPSVIPINLKFGQGKYREILYIVGFNLDFARPENLKGILYSIELNTFGIKTPRPLI